MRKIQRYGWSPDLPDHRDLIYKSIRPTTIPNVVDLRPNCPDVYDQGSLGSCTANGIAFLIEFEQMKQLKQYPKHWTPSRLFIYYNERVIEGTVRTDAGAQIRDGIKTVVAQGAPAEQLWPYNISKFKNKPSIQSYKEGLNHQVLQYQRLTTASDYQHCLADGYPIVFGFSVYEYFESDEMAKTGILKMPQSNEKSVGGHCVALVGYDLIKRMYLVRNSWGVNWGLNGYFWMPFDYVHNFNLCDDFWKITLVE